MKGIEHFHRVKIRTKAWPAVIVLLLCLFLPLSAVGAAPERQDGSEILLQDAVEQGLVDAWAQPNPEVMGFRQPMLLLTVTNKSGSPLNLRSGLGLRLMAADTSHADLITAGETVFPVTGTTTIELSAFSLQYERVLPSGMEADYRYRIGEPATGEIVELLHLVGGAQKQGEMGAQLAVWSIYARMLPEDLTGKLSAPLRPEDIREARDLLTVSEWSGIKLIAPSTATPVAPPTDPAPASTPPSQQAQPGEPAASPESSTAPAEPENRSSVSWLAVGALCLGGVAGVGALVLVVFKPRKHAPEVDDQFLSRASTPAAKSIPRPEPAQDLVLVGKEGPLAGREFRARTTTILTRDPLDWFLIGDPGVSTPHAMVSLAEGAAEVKDLASESGTWLDQTRLVSRSFVSWQLGCELRLGNTVLVPFDQTFIVKEGQELGTRARSTNGLVIIARETCQMIETGSTDRSISAAHLLLIQRGKQWLVRDLNSSNGVKVNQQIISGETLLVPGTLLSIGRSEFEVKIGQGEA